MKAEISGVMTSRVVISTNVWISAMRSKTGAPAQVVRRILVTGLPVFSAATFAELETRLWKPKFDPYMSMEIRRRILHDADDDKFIHTALAASAPWLVTGDQDLLVIGAVTGVRILAPAEALRLADFCQ